MHSCETKALDTMLPPHARSTGLYGGKNNGRRLVEKELWLDKTAKFVHTMRSTPRVQSFKKKRLEIDDFAKLVITEAKKAGIAEALEYDRKSFVLTRGGQRLYLANLFDDYCQADGEHKKAGFGKHLGPTRSEKAGHSI